MTKALSEWAQGDFIFNELDGKFYYGDVALPDNLNEKIAQMATEGQDPTMLFNFWVRLKKNPSWRSVQQLFGFLNHDNIPLTKDGCFLAYKSVRGDWKDMHSGVWDNKPGTVNKMPRNEISDDPNHACHVGFHVGALDYARSFGGSRIVVCKVDPEHVVCVPFDASHQKMRVCEYKVVAEYSGQPLSSTVFDDFEEPESVTTEPLKERTPEVKLTKKASGRFAKYDKMTGAELLTRSIDELRQYAGKGLQMAGASKILGGKVALVEAIEKVRGV